MEVPSIEEWRSLYEASDRFFKTRCWEYMQDRDLFAVQNPVTGEMGYCSVLGNLDEFLGLCVYIGDEGFEFLNLLSSLEEPGEIEEIGYRQKCLLINYGGRDEIEKEELKLFKELGLKFKGKKVWPWLRSCQPGYLPWFLSADEARYLTLVFEQAVIVAERFRKNPSILQEGPEGKIMARVRVGNGPEWEDTWVSPSPSHREPPKISLDDLRLARIGKSITSKQGSIGVDWSYLPVPIQERPRPFFARTVLFVEESMGLVLGVLVMKPSDDPGMISDRLLDLIENRKSMPRRILVTSEEIHGILRPATARLGIELQLVESIDYMDGAMESLIASQINRFQV